jgi:hypothetical protein
MLKENVKTSHTDVMPAMADFLWSITPEEVQQMPATFQLIFNLELETEHMDDLTLRKECINAISILKCLAENLQPFTGEEFRTAVTEYRELQKCLKNV